MKKKECLELSEKSLAKGYTMRSNVNPDAIRSIKQWNIDSAKIINEALKHGDGKTIIKEMQNAEWRNRRIRELSMAHDKIVYDANGVAIAWWNHKELKAYELEQPKQSDKPSINEKIAAAKIESERRANNQQHPEQKRESSKVTH